MIDSKRVNTLLMAICLVGCSTSNSGGYAYKAAGGTNASQQQNGAQSSASSQVNQAQISTTSSWSSKSSISVGK